MALVSLLVEGALDEQIGIRLIEHSGHEFGASYGKKGWGWIRKNIQGFARTSRATGVNYLAIVDLDGPREPCAPSLVENWLPAPETRCLLRVAVTEVESWLLADDLGISKLLGVARNRVGVDPEVLNDPKQHLINLARRSRRSVAKGIVPEEGLSASEGRLYTASLKKFVSDQWDIERASTHSPSLMRCVARLFELDR